MSSCLQVSLPLCLGFTGTSRRNPLQLRRPRVRRQMNKKDYGKSNCVKYAARMHLSKISRECSSNKRRRHSGDDGVPTQRNSGHKNGIRTILLPSGKKYGICHFRCRCFRCYSGFSHDVTAAMLEPLNKETAAMLEPRPNPSGI